MDSKITMDSIITTLGQIGAASQDDETAAVCQDAVRILYAISEEGAKTPEEALDIIHDYRLQAKQDAALRQKHAVAGKPFLKDGVWHCPSCNRRTTRHCCGKKLAWR